MKLVFLIIILFFIWFLNLEINPTIRGIWLRINVNGNNSFQFQNVINLMKHSFIDKLFWIPKMWDINIITFIILGISIFYLIKYLVHKVVDKSYFK